MNILTVLLKKIEFCDNGAKKTNWTHLYVFLRLCLLRLCLSCLYIPQLLLVIYRKRGALLSTMPSGNGRPCKVEFLLGQARWSGAQTYMQTIWVHCHQLVTCSLGHSSMKMTLSWFL